MYPKVFPLTEELVWKQFYKWKARLEASLGGKCVYFATLENGKYYPHLHILLKHPNLSSINPKRWEWKWQNLDECHDTSKILTFEDGAIPYILKRINIEDGSINIKIGGDLETNRH